jgi:hypothetical protein
MFYVVDALNVMEQGLLGKVVRHWEQMQQERTKLKLFVLAVMVWENLTKLTNRKNLHVFLSFPLFCNVSSYYIIYVFASLAFLPLRSNFINVRREKHKSDFLH